VIELLLDGSTLTGTVGQTNNGRLSAQPIEEGYADGNTVSFKASNMDAGARRRVTFTGTIDGDRMTLGRAVEVLPRGRSNGRGIFGVNGPPRFAAMRDSAVIRISMTTDAAGQYRLRNLPFGHYQISAGSSESTPVTVRPGEKAVVNIRLAAAPANVAAPVSSRPIPGASGAVPTVLPNTVLICRENCTVVEASAPTSYQFGESGTFHTISSPVYPLVVDCNLSCSQPGLYAMQQEKAYTVTWKDAQGVVQPPVTVPALPPAPRALPIAPSFFPPRPAVVGPGGGSTSVPR
jgi:hypothetical protein